MTNTVKLPRRLMSADEILAEIYLQTGTHYACPAGALVRQIDVTPFGGAADARELVQHLAPAVSIRKDVIVLEESLEDVALADLERSLKTGSVDQRRLAAYQLGSSGSTRALAPLFRALEDKNESVRHHALRALIRLESDFDAHHPPGRISILQLDGTLPRRGPLTLLKTAHDPTTNQWVWSATLLGRLRSARAKAALQTAVTHSYARTRETARAALAAIDGKSKDATTRPRRAPHQRRDTRSARALIDGLSSKDVADRVQAVRRIARRNDVGPEALLARLRRAQNPEVRAELLLALGRKGGSEVWDVLLEAVDGPDTTVRRAALRALDRCPETRAADRLMAVLIGRNVGVEERNLAALSLGTIGSAHVVKRLSAYVARTEMPVSGAGLAMGLSGRMDATPALARCLTKRDELLKQYAYSGLSRIGTAEAVDAMVRHAGEYDNTTRFCASSAIRRVRDQSGIDRFVALVRAGKTTVAGHGLEESADPRGVDALIEALSIAKGPRLRLALQALGRIGDPKAGLALCNAMDHPRAWVRHEALRALRWRWYWSRPDVRAAIRAHPEFKTFLESPPSLAEQPENTWVLRHWPIDMDDYRACNTTYEAGIVFDEDAGVVLRWGAHGKRCDVPQLEETWLYDPARNTWRQGNPPIVPVGTCGTVALSYDKGHRRVVSVQSTGGEHGWQWERSRALRETAPWIYDVETDRWSPARPLKGPGGRKAAGLTYLDRHGVHMLFSGWHGDQSTVNHVWIYDLHTNTWHKMPVADPQPPAGRIYPGIAYLPDRDRVLFTGGRYRGADNRVWLYDLKANTWTDAGAAGDPPQFGSAVVRDSVTGTVLAFTTHPERAPVIWQFDPDSSAWRKLPRAPEPTPHLTTWDVCYDPIHNVVVLCTGIFDLQYVDYIGAREVWTYKFRERRKDDAALLPAPRNVRVEAGKGHIDVRWDQVPGAAAYRVSRGRASAPWQARLDIVNPEPIRGNRFRDPQVPRGSGKLVYYSVVALDGNGQAGLPSPPAPAQPPVPDGVVVSVLRDRTVNVRWSRGSTRDVIGYHVYAAWLRPPRDLKADEMRRFGKIERLTSEPVPGVRFHDARPLSETAGVFNHEVRAYVVRAVNALGVESGPSAAVYSLTSSVPHVRAVEQPDGSTLVTWEPVPEQAVRGYAVYRMDELDERQCVRLNPYPISDTRLVDWPEVPRAERRRYFVVAVDALGQEGLPSAGAWAFGRP